MYTKKHDNIFHFVRHVPVCSSNHYQTERNMYYKVKNIVMLLRVLSDFIILKNFGKKIHMYVCMHVCIKKGRFSSNP